MSKTLAQLRAHTRTYLDEITQDDWTDTEVDREVNIAYFKVYTAVVNVFEDYYSTKTTLATVANQQEYALPTDLYKIRRVEINYQPSINGSIAKRAIPVSMDSVLRDLGNSALGISVYRNPAYYRRGDYFGFIPVPTESGADMITLWYIGTISELSSDSDTIHIPFADRYYDTIALEAAGTLLRKGQQEEAAAKMYLQDAETRRQQMQVELKDSISDDNMGIVDTVGDDIDFSNYSTI